MKGIGLRHWQDGLTVLPVIVGNDRTLREVRKRIYEKGLYPGVITYPVVSHKRTRLRLSISAEHRMEQMNRCISILKKAFAGV